MIKKASKYDHVTPIIKELGWMNVKTFISYRISTITYQCLSDQAPQYLIALLKNYEPSRNLRSQNQLLLEIPNYKTTVARRSFSFQAPKIWNDIPIEIKSKNSLASFKKSLKNYYVKQLPN